MSTSPLYDLNTIKYAVDDGMWKRAIALYEGGKITDFKEMVNGYTARVLGGSPYRVSVSNKSVDRGDCDCYMGQQDELCKHMIAVAVYAVCCGRPLTSEEKRHVSEPVYSGIVGNMTEEEMKEVKKNIGAGVRCIRAYEGPSRTWFAYQNKLDEGCARIATAVATVPANAKTAKLLIDTLLKLDTKLATGGVDDSDGTVGHCMSGIVEVLLSFADADPKCIKVFKVLEGKEACFEWKEPLVRRMKTRT